jgi:hypothetical protein
MRIKAISPNNPMIPPIVAPTETALSRPESTAIAPWVAAPESADEVSDILGLLLAAFEVVGMMATGMIGTSEVVVIV